MEGHHSVGDRESHTFVDEFLVGSVQIQFVDELTDRKRVNKLSGVTDGVTGVSLDTDERVS